MKFYVISKRDSGKLHCYPLPGQKLDDGSVIDCSKRVQCDRAFRDSKPSGTIFELLGTTFLASRGTHYVSTGCSMHDYSTSKSSKEFVSKEWEISEKSSASSKTFFIKNKISGEAWNYDDSGKFSKRPRKITEATKEVSDAETKAKTEETKVEEPKVLWIDEILKSAKCPTSSGDGFYVSRTDWRLLVRNIKRQVNTLITGPAGTGKTSLVKRAAEKLGLPLYTFDMGAMIDPISSLLGVHRLQEGKSIFDYAQFTKVIQSPCIILLDELSRAPMGVGNILFPCLDDRRVLPVEIAAGSDVRSINIHPEVTFIATANIGAEYTGTTTLDRALTNRFFPLELRYLPNKEEEKVLCKRCNITPEQSTMIVKVANTIRTMNSKLELSMAVSVRETLMISQLVEDGWSLGDAMKSVYLPMFEGQDNEGERGKVFKVLASY